jgi:DNA polymerase III delta prime subunit
VLRNLRPHAEIVNVNPPQPHDLAARLCEICKWEGLTADLGTMLLICEITNGDMRSALNTLQYMGQRTSVITKTDLLNSRGSKDASKDWSYICKQIFQVPTAKQKKGVEFQNGIYILLIFRE